MNAKSDHNETTDSTADNNIADAPAEIEPMRILKIATCPSLSGRSELTYQIGCGNANAIHFRVWANTVAGMFNNAWVWQTSLRSCDGFQT